MKSGRVFVEKLGVDRLLNGLIVALFATFVWLNMAGASSPEPGRSTEQQLAFSQPLPVPKVADFTPQLTADSDIDQPRDAGVLNTRSSSSNNSQPISTQNITVGETSNKQKKSSQPLVSVGASVNDSVNLDAQVGNNLKIKLGTSIL